MASITGDIYVDSMFSKVPAISGYAGRSVYTNGLGYDRYYAWKRKSEHADTFMSFVRDVGTPHTITSDGALEETHGRARDVCRNYCINLKVTIPQLYGRTPTEFVEGSTPDILAYAMFDWYQHVYYYSPTA
jgi:hypothetical protein